MTSVNFPSDPANKLVKSLNNLKIKKEISEEPELSEPSNQEKEIAALKAEVQYLKTQLESRMKAEAVIPKANLATDKLSFDNTFPDLSTPVTIQIGNTTHTFPRSILKMAPEYQAVDQNVTINENYNPDVISSLIQFLTMQFYAKNHRIAQIGLEKLAELTDKTQEIENFEQLYSLAGNFGFQREAITEYLKLSVQAALSKDQTGELILRYISLVNNPKYPWLFEVIKSTIKIVSEENRNVNVIITFYKNFFSYLNSKKDQRPEKNEAKLLAVFLVTLFPFHLDLKTVHFQGNFIPSICNAWIFLHPHTFPRFDANKEKIFLEVLRATRQTPEIQLVSVLFNSQLTASEVIKQIDQTNNTGTYSNFCRTILTLDIFLQDKSRLPANSLFSISKTFSQIIEKEKQYAELIFEILEDPFFPKTNNSYKSSQNVNPETTPLTPEEIIELFSEIQDFIPNNKILMKLIEIYEKANKREASLRLYEKVFDLDPSSENVSKYFAYLEILECPENHYENAIDFIKRAINHLDPNDLKSINKFRYKRAQYLYSSNRNEEAIEELTKILNTNDIEHLQDATNLKVTILKNPLSKPSVQEK